ncbi:hypothetical protein BVX97_04130 [bacterium E08(2017)]|nr:hypothetical protein BVX97_04130 [bacterium E08(2017)]
MAKKKSAYNKLEPDDAYNICEFIADIVNNTINSYWLSATDAATAAADCYQLLGKTLEKGGSLAFRVFDGSLMLNGDPIRQKSHNIEVFVEHLDSCEIDNFTITSEIDNAHFTNFLEVLEANKYELEQLGGFGACLERFDIKGVETKKIVFQEVSEEEVIVDKDDLKKGSGSGEGGPSEQEVGSILAFLKGEIPTDDKDAVKQVQETATDAGQMADLIMNAADIRQQENPLEGGETMIDFVVGCLRRTYDGLTQQKSASTKTGKKRITKNLLLLEKEVLDRMRAMSDAWDDDDLQAIVDATQEMTDELKIDSLVDEYFVSQQHSEEKQKQIMEYIRSVGIDNVDTLKQKLKAKGMQVDDWQQLVVKSGKGGMGVGPGATPTADAGHGEGDGGGPGAGPGMGPGEGGEGLGAGGGLGMGAGFAIGSLVEAISHLDVVLNNMEKDFNSEDVKASSNNSAQLVNILEDVTGQVRTMTEGTSEKIDFLLESISADSETINHAEQKAIEAGVEIKITRQNALKILVDIVREIEEPLAIIQSSLEMIQSNTMGGLNEAQGQALHLAFENTEIISGLMRKLETIAPE